MEFTVIPEEQTPKVPDAGILWDHNVNMNREKLDAFLEFARSRGDAVGLAANQCAIDGERFMLPVFAFGGRERNWRLILNPVITRHFGIKEMKAEGCLTWKGLIIEAERYRQVEVKYYDMDGNFHQEVYKGFDAQIWQHEVNHLNGVEEKVVHWFNEPPAIQAGRNEPCPCGSGLKYKKCCFAI